MPDHKKHEVKNKAINWQNKNAITYWDELYVRVDRQFTERRSKYFLTVEELYVFILISIDQRKDWSTFTCIHMIEEIMPIRFFKGVNKNRETIATALNSLATKDIIEINGLIDYKQPYSSLFIRIQYDEFEQDGELGKWRGFNQIGLSVVQKAERIEHLYMYCTIKGYDTSSKGGFRCSYSEWSELLNRSLSSVKRYAKEVVKEGYQLIEINYGDYLEGSRTRQDVNVYRTSSFLDSEKTTQTKQKEKSKNNDKKKKGFGDFTDKTPF